MVSVGLAHEFLCDFHRRLHYDTKNHIENSHVHGDENADEKQDDPVKQKTAVATGALDETLPEFVSRSSTGEFEAAVSRAAHFLPHRAARPRWWKRK